MNIDIFDREGWQYARLREWLIVPLDIIERVIESILSENIVGCRYDGDLEMIVPRVPQLLFGRNADDALESWAKNLFDTVIIGM